MLGSILLDKIEDTSENALPERERPMDPFESQHFQGDSASRGYEDLIPVTSGRNTEVWSISLTPRKRW